MGIEGKAGKGPGGGLGGRRGSVTLMGYWSPPTSGGMLAAVSSIATGVANTCPVLPCEQHVVRADHVTDAFEGMIYIYIYMQ